MKKYYSFGSSRFLLLFFALWLFSQNISADVSTDDYASLKQYFNKCVSQLHSPDVLKMADTLYQRAVIADNKHFQIIARLVVLDYYYFQSNKEKVLQMVAEVKQLSRKYNELDNYYFAWGSRLITFYLKNGMPNHALLEAQKMLREAQKDNFPPGIAECYKAMANIQSMQSNAEQAAINFQKLIDIVEKTQPNDLINLPVYYYSLIDNLLQSNRLSEAGKALNKIKTLLDKSKSVTAYQKLCVSQGFLQLYLKKKDIVRARKEYEKIKKLFATYEELNIYSIHLYGSQLRYYIGIKEYAKALAVIDSIWKHNPTTDSKIFTLSKKGDIYWSMNKQAEAAQYYREYISIKDSVYQHSIQNSANEIAGILNLRQLEQEKQLLMIDIKDRKLTTTYWAIGTLIVILMIVTIFMFRIYRLNRQLKDSKQVVLNQNQELLQSSEELRIAKEQAEEASQMKTHFIQNITHEVRTPLNAIVGFSQVLVEFYQKPETEEYASLITVNSNYLLRLFNDVLELSNIDQISRLPYDKIDDINSSCQAAIHENRPFVKDGVELKFNPSEENLYIHTNPDYVTLILNCLLHNATKFTQTGSITLEYNISPSDGIIRYSVTDTGIGVPLDQQEVIFERFKKLDYFAQGSGLGLSVSRTVATKLGGTLHIDAAYSSGSRFILTLPFIPQ